MTRYSATRHFSIRFDQYYLSLFSSFIIISHHFSSCSHHFSSIFCRKKKSPKSTEYLDESLVLGESTGAAASFNCRATFSRSSIGSSFCESPQDPQDSMRDHRDHRCSQVFSAFFISKVGTWLAPQRFFAARRRASSELIRPVGLRHEFCGVLMS